MQEGKAKVIGKAVEIEGPKETCEKCGVSLPQVDKNGSYNFVTVGCHGDKKIFCNACKKGLSKPEAMVGWHK